MTRTVSDSIPAPSRQRIAKAMARAGLCSRRDAEAWIAAGRVSVNGTMLTSPAVDVNSDDRILVDGEPLPAPEKTRLLLFHKPRGLVTSDHDPEGRSTVIDYLRAHWPEGPRVVTVGRLDINSEGLLLLTNDGGLARVLELPRTGWTRRYRVRAKGTADPSALDALAKGITIDGIRYAGMEAKLDRVQGANVWLTMGLREGKNREIKRVLEHLGLEVNRLIRLSFGPFRLLDLAEGAVEEVPSRILLDQLGPTLSTQAGIVLGDGSPEPSQTSSSINRFETDQPRADKEKRSRATADRQRPSRLGADKTIPRARLGADRAKIRRSGSHDDAPPPRHRPAAGSRQHISAMRSDRRPSTLDGARQRIERTKTQDRRERTIIVERLVSSDESRLDEQAPRRKRSSPNNRTTERSKGRRDGSAERHTSPSARGKRERIARSGAPRSTSGEPGHRPSRRTNEDGASKPRRRPKQGPPPRATSSAKSKAIGRRTDQKPRGKPTGNRPKGDPRRPRNR